MIFTKRKNSTHLDSPMFLGESVDIARYDQVKYPQIDRMTEKQLGFFWRPDEIDVSKDRIDFMDLTDNEKFIFTSNLKRQILLDSIQGRGVAEALLSSASIPEMEPLIMTWGFYETIHSRSYTHIIRNIYSNPSIVFDGILDIKEILTCADDISKYYDDYIQYKKYYDLFGEGRFEITNKVSRENQYITISKTSLKEKLWLLLHCINALEGIRFYVSFACSWAFAELKKMEGNAKIIKLICRDENIHLAASTTIIKSLLKEDPEYTQIKERMKHQTYEIFQSAIEAEKIWAKYLFQNGSMIGLNYQILATYIEWIGVKRMRSLGIDNEYSVSQVNPLPWTEYWISGSNVQVAPQETDISSYIIGGVKQDVSSEMLLGLSL